MRAKCPHCEGAGCDQPNCVDGYLEVKFAEGDWWTRQCLNMEDCGFANGGRICEGFPQESSGPCVICKGPTNWVPYEEAAEDIGYVKNYDKFAIQSLSDMVDRLRESNKQLREKVRSWPEVCSRNLSIEECKMLDICSICHKPFQVPFQLAEWAHTRCLENAGIPDDRPTHGTDLNTQGSGGV